MTILNIIYAGLISAFEINDRNKLEDPKRFKFSTFQNYSTRLRVITEKDYLEQTMIPQAQACDFFVLQAAKSVNFCIFMAKNICKL